MGYHIGRMTRNLGKKIVTTAVFNYETLQCYPGSSIVRGSLEEGQSTRQSKESQALLSSPPSLLFASDLNLRCERGMVKETEKGPVL